MAPELSFVHDYPGTVNTTLLSRFEGLRGMLLRTYVYFLGRWICVPIEESGERHLYLATSARYPPVQGDSGRDFAVPRGDGIEVAQGNTGQAGSGVYSVGWDCDSASSAVQELLADLRGKGMVEEVWRHTENKLKSAIEQGKSV